MGTMRWSASSFLLLLIVAAISSSKIDDYADIMGPYCELTNQCCNNRQDECSVQILGTLCYCDDFCNQTRIDDCCPDYYSFCKGIPIPTTTYRPPPPPTTTRTTTWEPLPPLPIITCQDDKGKIVEAGDSFKKNCNQCSCLLNSNNNAFIECEQNACLIEDRITRTVNDNRNYGWSAANYSEFWGKTLDEGIQKRLGTLEPQKAVMSMRPVRKIYDIHSLPKHFDSSEKWHSKISQIEDQGWCGSSWAISTASVASDRYAIVSNGLEDVKLSAQNLLSCETNGQQSCNGGQLDKAWWFIRKFGLVDDDCFPYVGRNEPCTIKKMGSLLDTGCNPPKSPERKHRYKVGPAYRLRNETDIMYEILQSGPVQATMKVYHDFFSYREGIYKHTDLSILDKTGYHSVKIVGWGEEYTYKGLEKYWKVANSWGREWGENGHFRIARGINECEIESFVIGVWPEVEKKILLMAKRSQSLNPNSI